VRGGAREKKAIRALTGVEALKGTKGVMEII
jgi:hypothetical protein